MSITSFCDWIKNLPKPFFFVTTLSVPVSFLHIPCEEEFWFSMGVEIMTVGVFSFGCKLLLRWLPSLLFPVPQRLVVAESHRW